MLKLRAPCIGAAGLVLASVAWSTPFVYTPDRLDFSLRQLNLSNISYGGRINQFASKPGSPNIILATTETGGLFRSTDTGFTWTRIRTPIARMNAVAFSPTQPNVAVYTAEADTTIIRDPDFPTTRTLSGGIFRSTNSGLSWTRVSHNALSQAGDPVPPDLNAYGLSFSPDGSVVVAATSDGIRISTDAGASFQGTSYTHDFAFNSLNVPLMALAITEKRLIVSGPFTRYSDDGGKSWKYSAGLPAVDSFNAGCRHPLPTSSAGDKSALVVAYTTAIYKTVDGGANFSVYSAIADAGPGPGGNLYVKAVPHGSNYIDVYMGDRYVVRRRLSAPVDLTTCPAASSFGVVTCIHTDPRDLLFSASGEPLLAGNDGGIERYNAATSTFSFPASGRGGYNALQAMDVWTQWVGSANHIYFGTQDNNIWMTEDWQADLWNVGPGSEGYGFSGPLTSAPSPAEKLNTVWSSPGNYACKPKYVEAEDWHQPVGMGGVPVHLWDSTFIQAVGEPPPAGFSSGLLYTTNAGGTWKQLTTLPGGPWGRAKFSRYHPEVVYQVYEAEFSAKFDRRVYRLARINIDKATMAATTVYPAMTMVGTLLMNPTMWDFEPVLAVDPVNPQHIMAAQASQSAVIGVDMPSQVVQSWDGGESFAPVVGLNGILSSISSGWVLKAFPHVGHISFCPFDSQVILACTRTGGIYRTINAGADWSLLPGTEDLPFPTQVAWASTNTAYVATYGRGIHRLSFNINHRFDIFIEFQRYIEEVVWDATPTPPPWGWVVVDGEVMGATANDSGVLKSIVLTPGAELRTFGFQQHGLVEVTYSTTRTGWVNLPGAVRPTTSNPKVLGFRVGEDYGMVSVMYGSETFNPRPDPIPFDFNRGNIVAPVRRQPELRLATAARFVGVHPQRMPINLAFARCPSGHVTAEVEGTKISRTAIVDRGGGALTLPPLMREGQVTVRLRHLETGRTLDKFIIQLTHQD